MMIGVRLPMPATCVDCPVRMECARYTGWLKKTSRALPRPAPGTEECLIIDLEDDGK